ncbi:MAG: acetolactate synthase small subunit [Firmicutes bacterium]|nr:acetolactate synthase small subunit [Bacillota bacterium]MDD4263798.1 acetolactate synthase small subunit [Bacillota bacterium]MDD4692890.1 acetolactate synthase small subunit [Bacillota bacterium]
MSDAIKLEKVILAVLVRNEPGVLSRVTGLFTRRGYNIHSLAVGPTEDIRVSRITIVIEEAEERLEQVEKQLHKLVDVLKIVNLTNAQRVERELALIQVNGEKRSDILQIVDIFRAKIVDVSPREVMVEVTGDTEKIDALIQMLDGYGISEIVRTGKIALARSNQ